MELTPVTAVGLVVALVGFELLDRLRRVAASASDPEGVGDDIDDADDGDDLRDRDGDERRASSPATDLREHAWKWAIPAVLLVVVAAEGNSLASIGWRVGSPTAFVGRVGVGFLLLAVLNVVSAPLWARVGDGGESLAAGLGSFAPLSVPERLFVAFTAGATEETAFHGYALERLLALTGSAPVAGGVSFLAFALGHVGGTWDRDAVLRIAQPALAMTLLYLWFRSLPVLIAVHALNDAVGLLLADRFTQEGAESDRTDSTGSAAVRWLGDE